MRVTLVETNNSSWELGLMLGNTGLDPLNLGYLGASVQDKHHVEIIQQRGESLEQLADMVFATKPDLVGYSCMTWSSPFALKLAEIVKRKTGCINVGGGYHFSAIHESDVADQVSGSTLDYIVLGEGEISFKELVNCLASKDDTKKVNGLAIIRDGNLTITEPRTRIKNLDNLPWPIRKLRYMQGLVMHCAVPAPSKQKAIAQASYSRGCPHQCMYCASPTLWGKGVSFRSPENMVNELEYLQTEFGVNYIFFTDLTFNLNKKKVYELCDEIKKRKLKIGWSAMFRSDLDKGFFERIVRAGCNRGAFGIEALEDSTLQSLGKPVTQKDLESVRIASSCGMFVRGYFILGWPEETGYIDKEDYITKSLNGLKKYAQAGVDTLRMSFLTPLPGTPLYKECKEKGLLSTRDFRKLDSNKPVIRLEKLTPEDLVEARERIFREFYKSEEYAHSVRTKMKGFPQLIEPYQEYFAELSKHGITVKL